MVIIHIDVSKRLTITNMTSRESSLKHKDYAGKELPITY